MGINPIAAARKEAQRQTYIDEERKLVELGKRRTDAAKKAASENKEKDLIGARNAETEAYSIKSEEIMRKVRAKKKRKKKKKKNAGKDSEIFLPIRKVLLRRTSQIDSARELKAKPQKKASRAITKTPDLGLVSMKIILIK